MSDTDKVYADERPRVVDFVFDERVAAVFADMIRRSAPGYEAIVALLGVIAERFARPNSTVYDLGCALGASMLSIHARVADRSIRFVGVDNSAPMLRRCRENLTGVIAADRFDLQHRDVRDAEIVDADMVVLNLTLQFLEPADRLGLLRRIHAGLNAGGVAVLAEKVRFDDAAEREWQQSLHDQFKAANGYSELEIAQKRAALEHVMTLDSADAHIARLRQAGFAQAFQWFQAFNFCAFVALK
ncbi:MAG: carboxy-S-adenosyl-L-methionine synthase CmoA [bacterium]